MYNILFLKTVYRIFDIYLYIIDNSINKNIDSDEIKIIYNDIITNIIEIFKNKEDLFITLIKVILKEKDKMFNDIKFCFVDGILKNKFPFINNKIRN